MNSITAIFWQNRYRWVWVVLFSIMALKQCVSLGERGLFNLDAICVVRGVSKNLPSDVCVARLPSYSSNIALVVPAVRLASLVALVSGQDSVARQVLQLELAPQQLDVVTGSRVLLLRYLYGQQSDDLTLWRGSASSQILVDTASVLKKVGTLDAATETEISQLAYLLDHAWRDQWQRALNARSVGKQYIERGQLSEAKAAYERAVTSLAKTNEPLAREYACYAYSRLGTIAEQQGDLTSAVVYYEQAILASPQHADFLRPVDLLLRQQRSLQDAYLFLADLRQKGRQDDPYLWSNSALVLIERGAPQMAERVLAEVPIELKNAPAIRAAEARLAMAQGKWATAESLYAILLAEEESANSKDHQRIASLTNALGEAIFQQGRYAEALHWFGEATRLAPTIPKHWYNLGLAYQQLGRRAEARAAFEKALALNPDYTAAQKALRDLKP